MIGALNVAFTFAGGATHWTGGFNYLRNAFAVLRRYESSRLRAVLFHASGVGACDLAALAAELQTSPVEARWLDAPYRSARLRDALILGADSWALDAFREHRIDVVFEAGEYFGRRFPVPALTWVADFQSHHMPHLFDMKARWRTYLGRYLQMLGDRVILLSSNDAAADCERFYPRSRGRTVVVPFAVLPPATIDTDRSRLVHYDLPPRYFYLPNQFWKHKNHAIVVEALAMLSDCVPDIVVVATGSPVDHRDPGYFARLQARVSTLGLGNRFRFLGLVPLTDVAALALHSAAVVNPSLFEGWSTTVEEAKSLGVPLVLSALSVHREQAGEQAIYFDPHSSSSVADALRRAWEIPQTSPIERIASAERSVVLRTAEFADRFAQAAAQAARLRERRVPR